MSWHRYDKVKNLTMETFIHTTAGNRTQTTARSDIEIKAPIYKLCVSITPPLGNEHFTSDD
jgi:hypothetical protein